MNRTTFFILGFITLFGFSAIGGIIMEQLLDIRFLTIFNAPLPWHQQGAYGLLYGIVSAFIAWEIVKLKFLTSTRTFFGGLIKSLNLSIWDIVFISFCAGTGEEILFRGAIQPYLGIWITAILFVAIHGYLNPWNWRISVYGLYMCFVIGGIGIMCNKFGITSSIAAHFAIDFYLLLALNNIADEPLVRDHE
ncbi:MAG TPA: CPBP family intramembrane metalloprotease [Flavobacteriales bacterium]|nr:CPBP family intramembrane metalloprotease [Flavobacteriales bacterium]